MGSGRPTRSKLVAARGLGASGQPMSGAVGGWDVSYVSSRPTQSHRRGQCGDMTVARYRSSAGARPRHGGTCSLVMVPPLMTTHDYTTSKWRGGWDAGCLIMAEVALSDYKRVWRCGPPTPEVRGRCEGRRCVRGAGQSARRVLCRAGCAQIGPPWTASEW